MIDVFLSHNSADKASVEALAKQLEDEARLTVWLDKWHLIPGDDWQDGIEAALDECRVYAVFVGPAEFGPWHHQEMRAALRRRVSDKRRVIPVLLPGVTDDDLKKLPEFLRGLLWVDFRAGLADKTAFRRLVAGIKEEALGRDDEDSGDEDVQQTFRRGVFKGRNIGLIISHLNEWKIIHTTTQGLLMSTSMFLDHLKPLKQEITEETANEIEAFWRQYCERRAKKVRTSINRLRFIRDPLVNDLRGALEDEQYIPRRISELRTGDTESIKRLRSSTYDLKAIPFK